MNILILIISLFLGFFARPGLAQEEITEIVIVDSVATEGVYIGQTFPVGISITGAQPNTIFYYKLYGGIDNSLSSIQTNQSLTYSSSWDNFPTVITDGDGNAYLNTSAYIDHNQSPGSYNLFIRLAYSDFYSPSEYKSLPQLINVLTAITTPIPTITPTSIPSPTQILSPAPTLIPTSNPRSIPTLTPTPTPNMKIFGTMATASATPTDIESLISSSEATDSTFIETGSNPVATEKIKVSQKSNLIPLIFISLGVLFLIITLIISRIKFKPKCLKK